MTQYGFFSEKQAGEMGIMFCRGTHGNQMACTMVTANVVADFPPHTYVSGYTDLIFVGEVEEILPGGRKA